MKYYILFNPLAGSGSCESKIEALEIEKNAEVVFHNVTGEDGYKKLLYGLNPEDKIVICGGDGTINRFVNGIEDIEIKNDILYFAAGTGNDFMNDLGIKPSAKPILINDYIKNLPFVDIKGKTFRFINGIGFGIDGYCCHEVDRIRREKGKKASYALVALKGLFKYFTPGKAKVTVDGETNEYERVWMVSAMKGQFFGGGIKIAPGQNRADDENKVTALVAHNLSRFRILCLFVSIFRGNHVKYTQYVNMKKCNEIKVEFDRPQDLQIDGEIISDVLSYTVTTKYLVKA